MLLAALSGTPDTVVLEFSATWRGHCREMEPVVAQLAREGVPIRKVDVDQQRALASEYRVEQIPCFVLLSDGKEVTRRVGRQTREQLLELVQTARPAGNGTTVRGQSPDPVQGPGVQPLSIPSTPGAATGSQNAVQLALQALHNVHWGMIWLLRSLFIIPIT